MILATAIGWSLQTYADMPRAALFGFVIGLVVARFVPKRLGQSDSPSPVE